ncbi:MAG TPA: hypothetical protein VGQ13_00665 [Nitrososphaera sp.]|jgi:hypothetical protein|nr:hypothetical protein [Nitrososphaera sp.]
MINAFEDESLGLELKGYGLVANTALETKIAIYTPEIVQSILTENPEIVERWLLNLHREYISKKKSCDFENDPVACFTLTPYEEFEKHFKSWQDGGIISITLPHERVIWVSKKPLISITADSKISYLVCNKCLASFTDLDEFEKHRRQENESKPVEKKKLVENRDYVPPDPFSWITP